jgi:1-deoxy-D-xylulose-5-phosphate reductoisomerase
MLVPEASQSSPPERRQRIAVLGSTGSIGRQTLDVVQQHPDRFEIAALAAGRWSPTLGQQVATFRPALVAIDDLADNPDRGPFKLLRGAAGLIEIATHDMVDIVVVATSGHAAILPTARAIEAGKIVALANKESLVCAGELIAALCDQHGVRIHPIDSEHSAIWQSLGQSGRVEIDRLILTASGGPFRGLNTDELAQVTRTQALNHPTWAMGAKITIDSATMMNKGLELIEAHILFGVPYDRIEVVVHPESIVHSLVAFTDGSQIAQLSHPDMRLPIQYALTYPAHVESACRPLSLTEIGSLHFEEPDILRFPALRLAREAGVAGTSFPTVLSAADEVAVAAFADERIRFVDIAVVVEQALTAHEGWSIADFDAVAEADHWATAFAKTAVDQLRRQI